MKTSITGHAHLLCYEAKDLIVGIAFINLNLMETLFSVTVEYTEK